VVLFRDPPALFQPHPETSLNVVSIFATL